jgi:flagellar motor switch/type III secretory pathway protein FliN
VPHALAVYAPMLDVRCPVAVMLGLGSITVRECLALGVNSVLGLRQSAGEDLSLTVKGVTLARGEVVIVEDSAALRVTEIAAPPPPKAVP